VKRRRSGEEPFYRDRETLDPLAVHQWEFNVLSIRVLDSKVPSQKSIWLLGLAR
jgi:hypothetical protein